MAVIVPRVLASPTRTAWPLPRLAWQMDDRDTVAPGARASSTARVPSVDPSLTTMISRSSGKSIVSRRSMTAAIVALSL